MSLQVSVPIVDGDKAIGMLVVDIEIFKVRTDNKVKALLQE
jgi:hypothetical protein